MSVQAIIGMVRALNGLLEKNTPQGEISLIKPGTPLYQGDVLTLLSGEAYIQFIKGFPEALALGKPVTLDGISPALKFGLVDINEELVKEALAKGLDPSLVLDVLGATAAGNDILGSGGSFFALNPHYSSSMVSAGYDTIPLSVASYTPNGSSTIWYAPQEAETTGINIVSPTSMPGAPVINLAVDSGYSGSDRITNNGLINVTSMISGGSWRYSLDSGTTWNSGAGSQFTLPEGVYSAGMVQTQQLDGEGNPGGIAFLEAIIVDNTAPIPPAPSLALDSGIDSADLITKVGQLNLLHVQPDNLIEFSVDRGVTWSTNFSPVEGINEVFVRQSDLAGNISPTSTLIFTLDTQASISINVIAHDDIINATELNQPLTLSGSTANVEAGQAVNINFNNKNYTATVTANGNWSVIIPVSDVGELNNSTTYTATAEVTDLAGNTVNSIHSVAVNSSAPVPTITLDPITADNVINSNEAGSTVIITGRVGGDAKANDIIKLSLNGIEYTGVVAGDKTFSINVPGRELVADDDKTLSANVVTIDVNGNQGTAVINQTYSINDLPVSAEINATGYEDPGSPVSVLLSSTDSDGTVTAFTINQLPLNGTLYTDAQMTHAVETGTLIAANSDNSVTLYFQTSSNWSGSTHFEYTSTDDKGDTSSAATANINIAAVADAPILNIVAATQITPPDTGFIRYTWDSNVLNLTLNGNGADPATLQSSIDTTSLLPNTTSLITNVSLNDVPVGTASLQTGLIYLEANTPYVFNGNGDDSIRIIVGNTVVASGTWGNGSGTLSGTFTPSASGYYNLRIYHNNSDGPGNFDINLNGKDLNTTHYDLY